MPFMDCVSQQYGIILASKIHAEISRNERFTLRRIAIESSTGNTRSVTDPRELRKMNHQTPYTLPQMINTYSLNCPLAKILFTMDEDDKCGYKLVSGSEASTRCLLFEHPEGRRGIHNSISFSTTNLRLEVAVINAFSLVFHDIHYRNPSIYMLFAYLLQ